jgi:hypothetical protein
MARIFAPLCVVLAAGALVAGALTATGLAAAGLEAAGFGPQGRWLWTAAVGLLAVLWLAGYWRGLAWVAPVGLVGFAVAAALGLLMGLAAGWMVFGLLAALCAWDLHRFGLRLQSVERVEAVADLERRHLQRLLAVAGLGLLAAFLALRIQVRLTFLMALLLGLLAVWGLSRTVAILRRESD